MLKFSKSAHQIDGALISIPIEDMYPYLERNEFNDEMIIKPL
jgi:hypothetical protein